MTTNTTDTLKNTALRFCEAIDRQDWQAAVELVAPDCRARAGGHDLDRDAWLGMGKTFAAAFPDGKHEIEHVVAEGDRVVLRGTWSGTHRGAFQGVPASGRKAVMDMVVIERIAGGKIIEHFAIFDAVALMQQIGAMPVDA